MAEQEQVPIGFGHIEAPEYLRPVYANFANVSFSPYDFRVTFALAKAPRPGPETEAAQSSGNLNPEAVADLVVPVGMIPGLIQALSTSYSQYLTNYGIPGMEQGPQNSEPTT